MTELTANEKLTALANAVRELSDTTDKKSLTEMVTHLESANDELEAQLALIEELAATIDTLPEAGNQGPVDTDVAELWNKIVTRGFSQAIYDTSTKFVGSGAFAYCSSLSQAVFTKATGLGEYTFLSCSQLQSISCPVAVEPGRMTFANCYKLNNVYLPKISYLAYQMFSNCRSLTTINLPEVGNTYAFGFAYCSNLASVSMPKCYSLNTNLFCSCSMLTELSFPLLRTIAQNAFQSCYRLTSLYLMGSTVCTLANSNAFSATPFAGRTTNTNGELGSIYVPASLLSQYQKATNWTYFSSRFVGV